MRKFGIVLLLASLGCGQARPGTRYATRAALLREMQGFTVIGHFAERFPATLLRIEESQDGARFRTRDGQEHRYPGFTGYAFRTVFLAAAGGAESVLVLRSNERTERAR